MDLIRYPYSTRMRFFSDSPIEVKVRWKFCRPGAKWLPFWSRFASGLWSQDHKDRWAGIGESPTATLHWHKPDPVSDYPGIEPDGTADQFANGLSIKDALPVPDCGVKRNQLRRQRQLVGRLFAPNGAVEFQKGSLPASAVEVRRGGVPSWAVEIVAHRYVPPRLGVEIVGSGVPAATVQPAGAQSGSAVELLGSSHASSWAVEIVTLPPIQRKIVAEGVVEVGGGMRAPAVVLDGQGGQGIPPAVNRNVWAVELSRPGPQGSVVEISKGAGTTGYGGCVIPEELCVTLGALDLAPDILPVTVANLTGVAKYTSSIVLDGSSIGPGWIWAPQRLYLPGQQDFGPLNDSDFVYLLSGGAGKVTVGCHGRWGNASVDMQAACPPLFVTTGIPGTRFASGQTIGVQFADPACWVATAACSRMQHTLWSAYYQVNPSNSNDFGYVPSNDLWLWDGSTYWTWESTDPNNYGSPYGTITPVKIRASDLQFTFNWVDGSGVLSQHQIAPSSLTCDPLAIYYQLDGVPGLDLPPDGYEHFVVLHE